jgi:hypothetical protein
MLRKCLLFFRGTRDSCKKGMVSCPVPLDESSWKVKSKELGWQKWLSEAFKNQVESLRARVIGLDSFYIKKKKSQSVPRPWNCFMSHICVWGISRMSCKLLVGALTSKLWQLSPLVGWRHALDESQRPQRSAVAPYWHMKYPLESVSPVHEAVSCSCVTGSRLLVRVFVYHKRPFEKARGFLEKVYFLMEVSLFCPCWCELHTRVNARCWFKPVWFLSPCRQKLSLSLFLPSTDPGRNH